MSKECRTVLGLKLCKGDAVVVRVGRYWYEGIVVAFSDKSIVVEERSGRRVAIALRRISTIEKPQKQE